MAFAFGDGGHNALLYKNRVDVLVPDIGENAKRYLRLAVKITAGEEFSLPVGYIDYGSVF